MKISSVVAFAIFFAAAGSAAIHSQSNPPAPTPPAAPAQAPSNQNAATPEKKVWTNDNLASSKDQSKDSTEGSPAGTRYPQAKKPNTRSANSSNGRNAKWYHDRIAKLQTSVASVDHDIADLQAAIDGKPTGDAKASTRPRGVKIDDWSVESAQLQKKRAALLAEIAALRDEAFRNGIPAKALP